MWEAKRSEGKEKGGRRKGGVKLRTGGHAANEPDTDPARDPAQETIPRTWNLVDPVQVIARGYPLAWM